MHHSQNKKINILLVEDNEGDVVLAEHAFSQMQYDYNIINKQDGEEALEFLSDKTQIRPDIILLDINLPNINGASALRKIKSNKNIRDIPVLILTSSNAERDINQCYDLHANAYIIKPPSLNEFISIAESIEQFWIKTSTYPNNATH